MVEWHPFSISRVSVEDIYAFKRLLIHLVNLVPCEFDDELLFNRCQCHSSYEKGFKIHIKNTGDWSNNLHEKLSIIKRNECIFRTKNYNVK